eukprot:2825625-Alexandrium_andersonii.AAC.1
MCGRPAGLFPPHAPRQRPRALCIFPSCPARLGPSPGAPARTPLPQCARRHRAPTTERFHDLRFLPTW